MKKKILSFVLAFTMLATFIPFVQAEETTETASQIKNIIYLIPDGGGYALYDFANMVKEAGGFDETKFPYKTPTETGPMVLRDYLAGSIKTPLYGGSLTDSAAASTALATGYKTKIGYVGVDHNKNPKASVLDAAMSLGKSAGLITTYPWMDATPAGFVGHASQRHDLFNLYQQIENKGLSVVLGAGYGAVAEYASIQNAVDNGYTVINNEAELNKVKPGDKIWGNIRNRSLMNDIYLSSSEPTLGEMTKAAITAMSDNENGFFLMVESADIDGGGDENNAKRTTSEYLAYEGAFAAALDFAKERNDTIVIGAPDHDTGGMNLAEDMSAEVAQVQQGIIPDTISWTGTSHTTRNCPVWVYLPEGVEMLDGLNPEVGDTQETRDNYVIENSEIAPWLAELLGVDLAELTDEQFVEVTDIGVYMPTTGKFTFNNTANGEKTVYQNESVYYIDDEEIDMGYKEAIAIDGKFYVPADIIDEDDWNYVTEGSQDLSGSGTSADPYIIDDANDFITFTGNIISGNDYKGKYIKQTNDVELAGNENYFGITSKYTFAGTYDGNGYTLNLGYTATSGSSPFPQVTGKILNLGTTGSITITGSASAVIGGIAYSVGTGGKIINCYSNVDLSAYSAGGIAGTNSGTINNCYYGGTINYTSSGKAIATAGTDAVYANCYYVEGCGATQSAEGVTAVDETTAKYNFVTILDEGREAAATAAGVTAEKILYWNQVEGNLPVVLPPVPIVFNVTVKPGRAIVAKGDGLQFTATVDGRYEPSQDVQWFLDPQTDFAGTDLDANGYLTIDEEETQTAFTIKAKSKQDGTKVGLAKITIGETTVITEPDGSKERPYIINDEADFLAFTNNIIAGNTYEGVYFKQTVDLDMAGYPGYSGIGGAYEFAGVYDGDGHTINLDIASDTYAMPFSRVYGTIMNLGTTGTITNSTYAGGICYWIMSSGKVINCWSDADLNGTIAAGIACRNQGIVANCYYNGTINADTSYSITRNYSSSEKVNTYYVGDSYVAGDDEAQITKAQLTENLHTWLNNDREESAAAAELAASDLKTWVAKTDDGPVLEKEIVTDDAMVSGIAITPTAATVTQGKGLQLSAVVSGEYDPSQQVTWSITPASSCAGTYIDKLGYLNVDLDETMTEFNVVATSTQNLGVSAASKITVKAAEPDGSEKRPYLIEDEEDFLKFTNALLNGETYENTYFKQTANIDMAAYPGYTGMGYGANFYGTYDGDGHTINLEIANGKQQCAFPYVFGTIMNLGTTGSAANTEYAAGICRSLRAGGKIVNCWSTMNLSAAIVAGITPSNYSTVANCYFNGTVTYTNYGNPVVVNNTSNGGASLNTYYVGDSYSENTSIAKITETQLEENLHTWLNNNLEASAEFVGVDADKLRTWVQVEDDGPVLANDDGEQPDPIVTAVNVTPATATVKQAESLQLSASVVGENSPSRKVTWAISPASSCEGTYIDATGCLYIDAKETLREITVTATSVQDTTKVGTAQITVEEVDITAEPDGSKLNPYRIEDEEDFQNFTVALLNGETYNGVYFRQTADLDMAGYSGYTGMGYGANFYGVYDGGGHTINLEISGGEQQCPFPYVFGTIMNLGTTGSINNNKYAAGICRSLRPGGKIVNCWSTMDLNASIAGGITPSNYSTIANCYFNGTVTYTNYGNPVVVNYDGTDAAALNTYYVGDSYSASTSIAKITETQLKENLHTWLNDSLVAAAEFVGVDAEELKTWIQVENDGPVLLAETAITTALSNVAYTDGNVTGTIGLQDCTEECVAYIAVFDQNKLVAAQKKAITADATSDTFAITCTLADDTTYTVKLLLWDDGMAPCATPASTTVTK